MIWFAPISLITWALELAVEIFLWVLGWLVVPYLAAIRKYEPRQSRFWPERDDYQWTAAWAQVFGNEEDGIDGLGTIDPDNNWKSRTINWSEFRRIVIWSCWRNPTGNLRFCRPFGFLIDPARVRSVGNFRHPDELDELTGFRWYYARHGLYSGLWLRFSKFTFRIGWKIYPADIHGVTDYRAKGCGFALQIKGRDK